MIQFEKTFKEEQYTAFSNGTGAMIWYADNCDRCTKAYWPDENKDWPSDKTMRKYVACGKECKLKYFLDHGFIFGTIPDSIAEQIGKGEWGLKESCMFYSDSDNDRYRPPKLPKRPPPDRTPNNQLVLPFLIDEILKDYKQPVYG